MTRPNYPIFVLLHLPAYLWSQLSRPQYTARRIIRWLRAPMQVTMPRFEAFTYACAVAACVWSVVCMIVEWLTCP